MSWRIEQTPTANMARVCMVTCMRLALKYTHRTPSPAELMEAFGMSRASAYRYVAAIREAKGESASRAA